jgi:hypothetical protein
LAAGFHEQREALQSQRGTMMDSDGALDELKHMSDSVFGEGLRNKIGNWSKNRFGQDLTQTSGERQEEANDAEIANLKRQEKLAAGMAKRMGYREGQTDGSAGKEQPPSPAKPNPQPETKTGNVETQSAFARQPLPAQSYARLIAARDGAADTARVATLTREDASRKSDGNTLERLRQDMNRNHAEATHAATRKHFSRP